MPEDRLHRTRAAYPEPDPEPPLPFDPPPVWTPGLPPPEDFRPFTLPPVVAPTGPDPHPEEIPDGPDD